MPFDPHSLTLYPEEPGVYLMKDQKGQVLYVGKAKNLRSRLRQYFSSSGDERQMVPYLIAQVETIDPIIALTEKDALLLENQLIKLHKPKYNVLLKDDKTFISLVLTRHRWPMLRLVRYKGAPKNDGIYFGPYTNALVARQMYDLICRLFPLRQCSDAELSNRLRPCLLYDMKRCLAPCTHRCTPQEYQEHVQSAAKLLKGKNQEVVADLQQKMEKAAETLEFEKASLYYNMLRQIEQATEVQHVDNPDAKNCDVLGLYREGGAVLIAQLFFRQGKLTGSAHFSFHFIASSDEEVLESFLIQQYKNCEHRPSEILSPIALEQKEALEEILSISLQLPQRGKKKNLLEMAHRNAKALFVREQDARSLKEKMLLDLQETLKLTRFPRRIECFDTSHLAGNHAVASLACFVNGEKEKSRKKLFKIKFLSQAEDYAAMRQVLERHFTKEKERNDFCDLLIVDGGKGQLNIAKEVLGKLEIASIDVIALTKENARHDKGLTQEKIYLADSSEPLLLDARSPMLFLLQKIRDEAHRQAIEFHRKQRSQKTTQSALDTIRGIGPIKKRALLKKFKSIKAIKEASEEELRSTPGLNEKDVQAILRDFR